MPGQQISQNLSEFLIYLQTRLQALETRVEGISPTTGGMTVSGGALEMKGNDINGAGDLSGETYSRDVDNIVSNSGGSVSGNLPMFSGTTGKVITDSAITSASVIEKGLNLGMVLNQAYPLAPAGQRDLWQYASGGTGAFLRYDSGRNIVYSCSNVAASSYSTNGGATFSALVYDIAPTQLQRIAFNGTNLTVAVGSTECYTSADGINFTKRADVPNARTGDMIYFNGLFVMGVNASATQGILTSPDGLTWTLRTATNIDPSSFRANTAGTILIGVSQTSPYTIHSSDGITWANGSGGGASRIIGYSDDKKEWLMLGHGVTSAWNSPDGITWSALGAIAPNTPSGNSLNWVSANGYNRWYVGGTDSDGNYTLNSTIDSSIAFSNTHLDGAIDSSNVYSGLYLPLYDRFLLGTNTSPFIVYGTARPLDIKALSDNIRVRNMPANCARFSTSADTAVNNTTTETSLGAPATFLGSLALQDSQPLGMIIKLEINLNATSAAGDTFTVRIKVNGTTRVTHAIVIPAAAANLPARINATFTVYATTAQAYSVRLLSAAVPEIVTVSAAYTRTVINTFSVTGQWGAALSTCSVGHIDAVVLYPNGA